MSAHVSGLFPKAVGFISYPSGTEPGEGIYSSRQPPWSRPPANCCALWRPTQLLPRTLFNVFSSCSSLNVKPSPWSALSCSIHANLNSDLMSSPLLVASSSCSVFFQGSLAQSPFTFTAPGSDSAEGSWWVVKLKAKYKLQQPLARSWIHIWARFTNRWQKSTWFSQNRI